MPLEDRIRPLQGVAVTIVDGHADETPAGIAFDETPVHLVQADEIDAAAPQPTHHVVEKARRDLQQTVGLKSVEAGRPHVMQGQDYPDTADERPHEVMRGAEIERFEAAANDR